MNAIDRYLADLDARLLLPPAARARLLEEVAGHLRESSAALGSETEAVVAFGSAGTIARAANRTPAAIPGAIASAGRLFLPIGAVAAFSAVAATLLARVLAQVTSAAYVYAPAARGVPGSAADCRYWERLHPGARSCAAAFTLENQHDSVALVLLAALVALLGLACGFGLLRLLRGRVPALRPSARLMSLAGAVTFVAAAVVLAGTALLARVLPVDLGEGTGLHWTCAAVAALVAVGYGTRAVSAGAGRPTDR